MPKEYKIDGHIKRLYSIGEVARSLDRSPQTIRLWEKKKVIPSSPFIIGELKFGGQGKRAYSNMHREALKVAVRKNELAKGKPIPKGFENDVFKAYHAIAQGRVPDLLESQR